MARGGHSGSVCVVRAGRVPGLIRWGVRVTVRGVGQVLEDRPSESCFLLPYIVRESLSVGSAGEMGQQRGPVGQASQGLPQPFLTLNSYNTANYFLILQDRKIAYGIC